MSKVSYKWFTSVNDREISSGKAQSGAAMFFLCICLDNIFYILPVISVVEKHG
jgi:hypothetical protein